MRAFEGDVSNVLSYYTMHCLTRVSLGRTTGIHLQQRRVEGAVVQI